MSPYLRMYSYFFFILFANIGGLQYMQSLLQTLVCITQGGLSWVRTWTSKAAFTIYFKSEAATAWDAGADGGLSGGLYCWDLLGTSRRQY